MSLSTKRQLTPKQKSILSVILKLRMCSIYHLVYYLNPELKNVNKKEKRFDNVRRSLSNTLKLLQNANFVKMVRLPDSLDVFYYLTVEGQREIYKVLNISEMDRGIRSGFDFELGYFDWRVPPYENIHSIFQTNVHASILSLNCLVESDSIKENKMNWVFGGVRLANICSVKDNLHASPRNSKIKDKDLYKPDGEIRFMQSVYDKEGQLQIDSVNGEQRIISDPEYYFMEYDRKSEYGERLDAKFIRLRKRLAELDSRNELKYFKGMIVVLESAQYTSQTQINIRHMKFVNSFRAKCHEFIDCFNIITTTDKEIAGTLLTIRREYAQDLGKALIRSWKFKPLADTFFYGEVTEQSKSFVNLKASIGNIRARYTANGKHLCLFINIEGLCWNEWEEAADIYEALCEKMKSEEKCEIVPIITYRKNFPYAPQMIQDKYKTKATEKFFNHLYILDLGKTRPILYKGLDPMDFKDAPFIIRK